MFPPTCCPCGFGPIGFLIQPYLILLGLPTILVPFVFPTVREDHVQLLMVAHIINFVLLSYVAEKLLEDGMPQLKGVALSCSHNMAAQKSDEPSDGPKRWIDRFLIENLFAPARSSGGSQI